MVLPHWGFFCAKIKLECCFSTVINEVSLFTENVVLVGNKKCSFTLFDERRSSSVLSAISKLQLKQKKNPFVFEFKLKHVGCNSDDGIFMLEIGVRAPIWVDSILSREAVLIFSNVSPSLETARSSVTENRERSLHRIYAEIKPAPPKRGATRLPSGLDDNTRIRKDLSKLSKLSGDVVRYICSFLRAPDLRELSCTSRIVQFNCMDVVPGLQLALFPHQQNSLLWMESRENRNKRKHEGLRTPFSGPNFWEKKSATQHEGELSMYDHSLPSMFQEKTEENRKGNKLHNQCQLTYAPGMHVNVCLPSGEWKIGVLGNRVTEEGFYRLHPKYKLPFSLDDYIIALKAEFTMQFGKEQNIKIYEEKILQISNERNKARMEWIQWDPFPIGSWEILNVIAPTTVESKSGNQIFSFAGKYIVNEDSFEFPEYFEYIVGENCYSEFDKASLHNFRHESDRSFFYVNKRTNRSVWKSGLPSTAYIYRRIRNCRKRCIPPCCPFSYERESNKGVGREDECDDPTILWIWAHRKIVQKSATEKDDTEDNNNDLVEKHSLVYEENENAEEKGKVEGCVAGIDLITNRVIYFANCGGCWNREQFTESNETLPKIQSSISVRGGMLCDEPGLGKTVTVLALILRSSGLWTSPIPLPPQFPDPYKKLTLGRGGRQRQRLEQYAPSESYYVKREHSFPSCATLIAVPSTLLNHWRNQFEMHADWKCVSSINTLNYDENSKFFQRCVYIDEPRNRQLPSADILSKYVVVITSLSRVSSEYRRERVSRERLEEQNEMNSLKYDFVGRNVWNQKKSLNGDVTTFEEEKGSQRARWKIVYENGDEEWLQLPHNDIKIGSGKSSSSIYISPLRSVFWLRTIVDEGHKLSMNKTSNTFTFLSQLNVERVWMMTGTPTKDLDDKLGLKGLQGLLRYFKHDPFGRIFPSRLSKDELYSSKRSCLGDQLWARLIRDPFLKGKMEGFKRCVQIMKSLMVRHTKADVPEIPKPIRRDVYISLTDTEISDYNSAVMFALLNVLMTVHPDTNHIYKESYLRVEQSKMARRRIAIIRRLCCGGGKQIPTIRPVDYNLTRSIMTAPSCCNRNDGRDHSRCARTVLNADGHYCQYRDAKTGLRVLNGFGRSKNKCKKVMKFINRAKRGEDSICVQCGFRCVILFVTPCAHLFCSDCIRENFQRCRFCRSKHCFEDLQVLQPGFYTQFKERMEEDIQTKIHNAARMQLYRSQRAAAANGTGNSIHEERMHQGRASSSSSFSPSLSSSSSSSPSHSSSSAALSSLPVFSEYRSQGGAKAEYICNRLDELFRNERVMRKKQGLHTNEKRNRPCKVVVYSQFQSVLNVVGSDLLIRFGEDAVAEFFGKWKDEAMYKFRLGKKRIWSCNYCGYNQNTPIEKACDQTYFLVEFPATAVEHEQALARLKDPEIAINEQTAFQAFENAFAYAFPSKLPYSMRKKKHMLNPSWGTAQSHGFYVRKWVHQSSVNEYFIGARFGLGSFVSIGNKRGRIIFITKCGARRENILLEEKKVNCPILLLSSNGSVGLDLSFVTHMFLLDKIWADDVETQVIARANRMGATQPVIVEQLIAKDTIEELMIKMNTKSISKDGVANKGKSKGKGKGRGDDSLFWKCSRCHFKCPIEIAPNSSFCTICKISAAKKSDKTSPEKKKRKYIASKNDVFLGLKSRRRKPENNFNLNSLHEVEENLKVSYLLRNLSLIRNQSKYAAQAAHKRAVLQQKEEIAKKLAAKKDVKISPAVDQTFNQNDQKKGRKKKKKKKRKKKRKKGSVDHPPRKKVRFS
eukprot:g3715.t1